MRAKCSICGLEIRSRRSSKGTAKANLLRAVRKHAWKSHRTTMISRIKAGKRRAKENPSAQDFIKALQAGPRAALQIYGAWTELQYQQMKRVMDAVEPLLPVEVQTAWKAIEAYHDYKK